MHPLMYIEFNTQLYLLKIVMICLTERDCYGNLCLAEDLVLFWSLVGSLTFLNYDMQYSAICSAICNISSCFKKFKLRLYML